MDTSYTSFPQLVQEVNVRFRRFFCKEIDQNNGVPEKSTAVVPWRIRGRMKTVNVALVLALNIGIDPPDVIKLSPCARMECWIEPSQHEPKVALEYIGRALQAQYERWQPRARYKLALDPTTEDIQKLASSLRRAAKGDRVLFHYNGRGVPKPTTNAEIWVFNNNYTQYVPLSLYDLESCIGNPAIYVFDCSSAGQIVNWFSDTIQQQIKNLGSNFTTIENEENLNQVKDYILLGACGKNELLPTNADLPADIFTACLTTPIEMALWWLCTRSVLFDVIPSSIQIPGKFHDRRTPKGELNWIFTAITDTIAWNVLPNYLFQKLFRQDLLVASLMRNYLLAERILKAYNCTPVSYPVLPPTYNHPLWHSWDLAVDICISQLLSVDEDMSPEKIMEKFQPNPFFADQLTAFEVWLEFGSSKSKKPEQLPIVLQVLLSKQHRLRALQLLVKFLDLGAWAINLALSVGIFPYILKLLQSPAPELREELIFIWTKILTLDKSCQMDLIKDNGHNYFIYLLSSKQLPQKQRVMIFYIVTVILSDCLLGQQVCMQAGIFPLCLRYLAHPDPLLRRWIILCIAKLWENNAQIKYVLVKENIHTQLSSMLTDPIPEVRAAAIYAFNTFFTTSSSPVAQSSDPAAVVAQSSVQLPPEYLAELDAIHQTVVSKLPVVTADMSPLARKELIFAIIKFIFLHKKIFFDIILEQCKDEYRGIHEMEQAKSLSRNKLTSSRDNIATLRSSSSGRINSTGISPFPTSSVNSVHVMVWKVLLSLRNDPFPDCAAITRRFLFCFYDSLSKYLMIIDCDSFNSNQGLYNHIVKRSQDFLPTAPAPTTPASNPPAPGASPASPSRRQGNASTPSTPSKTRPPSQTFSSNPGSGGVMASPLRTSSSSIPTSITRDPNENYEFTPEAFSSEFYQWSSQYFLKPLLNLAEEDPTSPEILQRNWHEKQHEKYFKQVQRISEKFTNRKLDQQIALMNDSGNDYPSIVALHPSESICITSFSTRINVWNWQESKKILHFKNLNAQPSKISCLKMINTFHSAQLVVGTNDGIVRVWRDIDTSPHLVTSWRAIAEIKSYHKNGLIFEFIPDFGHLVTTGNVPLIRVWDVERALSIYDVPSGADAVFALSQGVNNLIIGGGNDGRVRFYDPRSNPKYTNILSFAEHRSHVSHLANPHVGGNNFILSTAAGEVRLWDIRQPQSSCRAFQLHENGITAFSAHSYIPIFATGAQTQKIKFVNYFEGREYDCIRYHDGVILGQRIGPISSLAFHPYRLMLAAAATDSLVSLYQPSG